MSNRNRLTLSDRIIIEAGIHAKYSFNRIAREIGRETSTVIREVRNNRMDIVGRRPRGKNCTYAGECRIKNLCREECTRRCSLCTEYDCQVLCSRHRNCQCTLLNKPPYVCNTCKERQKNVCRFDKAFYSAEKANATSKRNRSEARKGIRLPAKELQKIDAIISPLLMQGQPLSHICNSHRDEIKVSERTIYNYIEAGELSVTNLDLRRKVKYRKRKKPSEIKANRFNYRVGRTYDDYHEYIVKHPNTAVVEMDTVRGNRRQNKVLLTMLFTKCSVMLLFLMENGRQESVEKVFDDLTKRLGIRRFRKLFPLILTDNGGEFKNALNLEYTKHGAERTKVFYCNPQASWQKPHIEKNHEYIRYVLPKGKTLGIYSQEDMTLLANHINSVSRPGLSHQRPYDLVETEEMLRLLEILNMSPVAADDICLKPELLKK